MQYNFSNIVLILHIKYFFTIGYDLKLLLTKVVGGHFFPDTVYDRTFWFINAYVTKTPGRRNEVL